MNYYHNTSYKWPWRPYPGPDNGLDAGGGPGGSNSCTQRTETSPPSPQCLRIQDTGKEKPPHPTHTVTLVLFKGALFPQYTLAASHSSLSMFLKLKSNSPPNSPTLFRQTQRVLLNHCDGTPRSKEPQPHGGEEDSLSETDSKISPAQRLPRSPKRPLTDHVPSFQDSLGEAREKYIQPGSCEFCHSSHQLAAG